MQRYSPGGAPGGVGAVGAVGVVGGAAPVTGGVHVASPPPAGTWQWRVPGSLAKATAGSGSPTGRHSAAPDSATTQPRAGVGVTPSAAEQRSDPFTASTHCIGTG